LIWKVQLTTSGEELFRSIEDIYSVKVIFGDDSVSNVKGKGIVVIHDINGKMKYIYNILLTPTFKKNLLLGGQNVAKL
jgi:hypothetical protein